MPKNEKKSTKFNRKEIKEKILKTKIGKTTNKLLIIFLVLFVFFTIGSFVTLNNCNSEYSINLLLFPTLSFLSMISALILCYLDGKMDGLIASYKN